MDKNKILSNLLPHIIAVFSFFVICLFFYKPMLLGNKTLPQHDINQWKAGATELLEYREKTDQEGLWTNSMFSGMPSTLVSTEYSGDLFKYFEQVFNLGIPQPARITFGGMLAAYIMLLLFGVRPTIAIMGAIAYSLASYNLIGITAGHNARIKAVAYMPLVIGGIHYAFNKNKILGCIITAIGLAMELRVNHLQITYYLVLIIVCYGVYFLYKAIHEKTIDKFLKTSGLLLIAAILAFGSNYGRIGMLLDYSKYSTRGKSDLEVIDADTEKASNEGLKKDYAFEYNNGLIEPLTMAFPHILGGGSREALKKDSNLGKVLQSKANLSGSQLEKQLEAIPLYRGKQAYTLPYYFGIVIFFLAILGLWVLSPKDKLWLVPVFLLGIMLSWGKNFSSFNYFMFDYFPGYNKFRSVTFAITISYIPLLIWSTLGLNKWFDLLKENAVQAKQKLGYAVATFGAILGVIFIYTFVGDFSGPNDSQIPYDWFIHALEKDRASLLKGDIFRGILTVGPVIGLLYYAFLKPTFNRIYIIIAIILIASLDIIIQNTQYLNSDKFTKSSRSFFAAQPVDKAIEADPAISYRVFDLRGGFSDARPSIHHQSIGGYHGAKLGRYQELIDAALMPEFTQMMTAIQNNQRPTSPHPIFDMLNTKYFIYGSKKNAFFKNENAQGNAWFVNKITTAETANEALNKTAQLTDLQTVIINPYLQPAINREQQIDWDNLPVASALGSIKQISYSPNKLEYESSNKEPGLAVFSEIYYPKGWKATIDGKEVPIIRANYLLRALIIPAGEHKIVFEFTSSKYAFGNIVMWLSSLLILFGALSYVFISFRKK